jgi:hypothetical protein
VGDRRVRAAGNRLQEAENLSADSWQGDIYAAPPPPGEDVTRRQHTGRVTLRWVCVAGFRTKLFACYCWPFGPVVEAVVGF